MSVLLCLCVSVCIKCAREWLFLGLPFGSHKRRSPLPTLIPAAHPLGQCAAVLVACHICRAPVTQRLRLF